jgi:hypothetical protein
MLLLIALLACDQKDEAQDAAAAALSAILPPLPSPSSSTTPSQTPTPLASSSAAADAGSFPLQVWMKQNMTPPMKAKNWLGMADSLEHAATLAPPNYATAGYANWVSIAKDGANAARAADLDAVKAACRGCHEQYKTKYRTEMRARPIP